MLPRELLEYLFGLERKGVKLGLDPTRRLLQSCGSPHRAQPLIQIAGTNGKGSTAAILARILEQHDLKAGLYTSPHLSRFNERIRIDGACIEDDYIVTWVRRYRAEIGRLEATFFEATTALALSYFSDCQVEVGVLETGLGGRLDATTAAQPILTALTPIDLDHTDLLGNTPVAIAREKAGILRAGIPCYSAPQRASVAAVIREAARATGAPLTFVGADLAVPGPVCLPGEHQVMNARLAWTMAREFLGERFDRRRATVAVQTAAWPGRYQQVMAEPKVIFDVAHNPHGVRAFLANFTREDRPGRRWLVLALQADKNAEQVLQLLMGRFDEVILTQTDTRNFLVASELATLARAYRKELRVISPASDAIGQALAAAGPDDLVTIIGSHYLGPAVAEIFKISFDMLG